MIGFIKAIKDYDLKRLISFHSLVKNAKLFAEEFVETLKLINPSSRPKGTILSDFVSGEMNAAIRKEKLTVLRN